MSSRRGKRKRRRIKAYLARFLFVLIILLMLGAAGIGIYKLTGYISLSAKEVSATTLYVHKNGSVEETIVEDFDETAYSTEKLQKMIDDETSAYGNGVKAGKLKFANGKAILKMKYSSCSDCAKFNDETFYAGKIDTLTEEGVNFSTDALSAGGRYAVVLNTSVDVAVPSKILYASGNVTVDPENEKKATVSADNGEMAYIVY